ncbi:hypothetical protein MRX96_002601 [Rhipicephalus microplus]
MAEPDRSRCGSVLRCASLRPNRTESGCRRAWPAAANGFGPPDPHPFSLRNCYSYIRPSRCFSLHRLVVLAGVRGLRPLFRGDDPNLLLWRALMAILNGQARATWFAGREARAKAMDCALVALS